MKGILFDLDNTLFDVEQYFSGAFLQISMFLSTKYKISKNKIFRILMEIWKKHTSMYPYLFNDLLDILDLKENVNEIVRMFNSFTGELQPYEDVIPTLSVLKNMNFKLGIITDGNVERQKRKIELLKLQMYFNSIIFTYEISNPKPSIIPYQSAVKRLKLIPKKSYYIGDNPYIDFEGAKKIGLITIRIKKGEFASVPTNSNIDIEINSISDLLKIIKSV